VFRALGVQTNTLDPATYTIGIEGRRVARIEGGRLSTHLECGRGILGPNADNYDVTMTLLVQLSGHASGGSTVRTTLDAYARPRASSGDPLHCASSRTLERRVIELIQMELSGAATRPSSAARGRVPQAGDYLRIECLSSPGPRQRLAEGELLGVSGEDLLLGVRPSDTPISVRASDVGTVQVRETRSRTRLGGLVGALAVGVAGGFWGRRWYQPENVRDNLHYGEGVFVGLGAVGGLAAGYLSGRVFGSFIKGTAWVDAPADWTLRFTGVEPEGASIPGSSACSGG